MLSCFSLALSSFPQIDVKAEPNSLQTISLSPQIPTSFQKRFTYLLEMNFLRPYLVIMELIIRFSLLI